MNSQHTSKCTEKSFTDEEITQALQTAAGFAEKPVKNLIRLTLNKDIGELFGDDGIPNDAGVIKMEPKEGSGAEPFNIKLQVVPSTYRMSLKKFGRHTYAYDEVVRLINAAQMYFKYAKNLYNIPAGLMLWRTSHGNLKFAGAPSDANHIGVIIL